MSRGFVKDGDQEEVPMVTPRAFLPKGVDNLVTPEGLKALNEEREQLAAERAASGDNYIARNYIEAKLKLLDERINTAVLVDPSKAAAGMIAFGSYVRYNDKMIRIVGVDEADTSKGLVSFISPIAKAMIGKKIGDRFEMVAPKGVLEIEVRDVSNVMFPDWNCEAVSAPKPVQLTAMPAAAKDKKRRVSPSTTDAAEREKIAEPAVEKASPTIDVLFDDIWGFLPLVSDRGVIVGRAINADIHKGNKLLHPAVHLHVVNTNGCETAKYWWHVPFGEKPENTVVRKASELLGVETKSLRLKRQYVRETRIEKELVSVYVLVSDSVMPAVAASKGFEEVFAKD